MFKVIKLKMPLFVVIILIIQRRSPIPIAKAIGDILTIFAPKYTKGNQSWQIANQSRYILA